MPPSKPVPKTGALCFQESKSNCTCGGAHSDSDPGETAEKWFDSRQPLPPAFSCQVENSSECCVMLCLRSLTRWLVDSLTRWLACNQHRPMCPMPQIHQMQTCCAHQSESCISPTLRSSHLPCLDLPSGAWGYGSTYTGKRERSAKVMSKVFSTWHRNHYISTWHLFNWCTFKMHQNALTGSLSVLFFVSSMKLSAVSPRMFSSTTRATHTSSQCQPLFPKLARLVFKYWNTSPYLRQ